MKFVRIHFILVMILILLFGVANVCAIDIDDANSTQTTVDSSISANTYQLDDSSIQSSDDSPEIYTNDALRESGDEIEVETWEDIQYYSSLSDKNYVLRLKENTNYYPTDVTSTDCQIIFNNNVTIIGAEGAYIGDSSPEAGNITYTAMVVPDNSGVGITMQGVTFKWIGTRYQPDGVFLQMGGNAPCYFYDCYFTNISTNLGHSSILHMKLGDAIIDNCTFINCTTDFGCLSVYNPNDDPTKTCVLARMNVTDSYFEGNYARTEPGCINNCGILVVRNSTFYNNSAFWWAGAIHTHGGANTTLYDCNFTDNVAGWNGGALYTYSYLQIYRTIFVGNNCTTNNGGGAIGACKYLHAPYIYIEDSLFEDNENTCWGIDELSDGTGRGGAISIMDEGALEVRNTTFIKNSASMGTAICAINGGLQHGSPDIIIVGNRFINHTRIGDVLDIRLATSSYCEIRDNYYYNNSFEFKKLRLLAGERVGDEVAINIDAELKNPDSFESDILDTSEYDVYVNDVYNKTVTGRNFTVHLENGETCYVYVAPCISDSISNKILVGTPKEYIYVSQNSGSDSNNGLNRTTPVKTISKAIELARTKGNIIIMDGTFTEYGLTVDYNLTITGENNVKFTGNIPMQSQTIFTVTNSSDLSLKGITFDNIVFTANTTYKNKKVILQDSGYLTIEDCTFSRISPSGNTGMNLIEAPNVEVYNSIFTNNNKASVYVTLIKSDEFLIDNCTFTNNVASQTSYKALITTVNVKTGVKGTVTNSLFENNKVKEGCIYFGSSATPLTVTNTKFIGNTVGGTSDHSSCIKIETSPTLRVDSVLFKDNINLGTRAAVIYSAAGSGSVFVTNSIIINNSYANNNNAVFSASTANNMKCYKNLNGNWWGNTLENYTVAPPVYATACSNWLFLNTTANVTSLGTNQNALVSFDLNNVYNKDTEESEFYDARYLPSFDLDIQATGGISDVNKATVEQGRGSAIYTLQSDSGSLTASYGNVESTINFTWSLVDPEISIDVEDITYGDDAVIELTLPSDISLTDISITLNQNGLIPKNVMTISYLDVGEYVINLTYGGNSKYNPFNLVETFNVNQAVPQLTINASEYYYGEPVEISVNTNADATGDITINAGGIEQTEPISNGKAEFILQGFAAGNYTVVATYSGNANYLPNNATSTFSVKKHNSTITISNSAVSLGSDVVLTFNVNSDASGTVSVNINGETHDVNVADGHATYTINSIGRGLYNIEATYSGDEKYLPSTNTTVLDVSRLNPNLAATVGNIAYGQDAIVQITLANDATGDVTVIIDDKSQVVSVLDGGATVSISGLTVGDKTALVKYSGDNTYLPKNVTATFNIAKSTPAINIEASNIKEGQLATIRITISQGATGVLVLNYAGKTENINIPRTGVITRTESDLAIGTYSVLVSYDGDSNYLPATASQTFSVDAWDIAQWPNEGYDIGNSGKSPYVSDANGNIEWNVVINGTVIGNMVIDGNGNIYITTDNGIYSYNSDGQLNWNFNSEDAGEEFSGVTVGRDVVISPKSEDKLYFINQTTGVKYNNNMYQGSSIFTPVIDENANIYITSEYQYSESSYNLVIVPYSLWQTSTPPTLISIGQHAPTTAPVILNEFVAIGSEDGLIVIDLSTETIIGVIDDVITYQRPVAGPDGNLYVICEGNMLMAVDPVEGIQWLSEITGTPGDDLIVNEDYVYSVTKEGSLYQYFYGEESLLYDFNESISSGMLLANGDTLYLGSQSGVFYAITTSGQLLWKVSLNGTISGNPIMDNNGRIYVISGGKIYALSHAELKDPQLVADIDGGVYGSDFAAAIDLDNETTGTVSIDVGTIHEVSEVNNGKVSFNLFGFDAGNYTVNIHYSGDGRFSEKSVTVPFTVSKADVDMIIISNNIQQGEVLKVNVTNFPGLATGSVTLSIGGKTASGPVINSAANLAISGLAKGYYNATVTYSGDANYNQATAYKVIAVGLNGTTSKLTASDISMGYGDGTTYDVLLTDSKNNPISGMSIKVNISGSVDTYITDANGMISVPLTALTPGQYVISATFEGDSTIASSSITNNVNIVKGSVKLIADDIDMGFNDGTQYTVKLTDGSDNPISGVILNVDNSVAVRKYRTDDNGMISVPINLRIGNYVFTTTFAGNDLYNSGSITNNVNVGKIAVILSASDVEMYYKDGTNYVVRFTDAYGNPIKNALINVNNTLGAYRYRTDDDGYIYSDKLNFLMPGQYAISAFFKETSVYKGITVYNTAVINKIKTSLSVSDVTMVFGDGSTYDAVLTDYNGNPLSGVTVKVNNTVAVYKYRTDANGTISAPIKLKLGHYTFTAMFDGNSIYDSANATSNVAVVKNAIKLSADDVNMVYKDGTKYVVTLTDSMGNPISAVNIVVNNTLGVYNYKTNNNGVTSVPLTNLKPGDYVISASYESSEYGSVSISNNVIVNKIKTELNICEINLDSSSCTVQLTDVNGNPIGNYAIKVTDASGLKKYVADANGFITVPINAQSNQYAFTAKFDGNAIYDAATLNNNLVLGDKPVVLSAADVSMYYNDGTNYVVKLTDINGNPISGALILVNNTVGVYKYRTDSNGFISVPKTNLKPGSYVFTAVFEGNGQYSAVNITNNVVVNKLKTKISVNDVSMNYNDGTNYMIKLTDANDNPISGVTVKVNNTVTVYRYKTNADGVISAPINLRPGEYEYVAFFEGDSIYNPISMTSRVVIQN